MRQVRSFLAFIFATSAIAWGLYFGWALWADATPGVLPFLGVWLVVAVLAQAWVSMGRE